MGKGPTINGVYHEEFGNYFKCKFTVNAIEFSCVEQYFQYKKCSSDVVLQQQILSETNPKAMWRLGQMCTLPEGWDDIKAGIMEEAIQYKFLQNENLRAKLVATYNDEIVFNESGSNDFWDVTNKQILERIRLEFTSLK